MHIERKNKQKEIEGGQPKGYTRDGKFGASSHRTHLYALSPT